jgi:uncharacterized protein YjbJ (UPF0337 family)
MAMNENQVIGAAKKADGRIESLVGEAIGDGGMRASGKVRAAKGAAQEFVGSVQQSADEISDVVDAMGAFAGKARDAIGRVSDKARRSIVTTDEIVTGHPYAVLAASALFGLVIGILLTATRPKVIYVRPRT